MYRVLNNEISQSTSTAKYTASQTVTINFVPDSNTFAGDSIFVHMWNNSNSSTYTTVWPGMPMIYDVAHSRYTCTFNPESLGFDSSHMPDRFKFSDNLGVITQEFEKAVAKEKTYTFNMAKTYIKFIAEVDINDFNK